MPLFWLEEFFRGWVLPEPTVGPKAQGESFLSTKVGLQKCCPFFVFVCFNGRHFAYSEFAKNIDRCVVDIALQCQSYSS